VPLIATEMRKELQWKFGLILGIVGEVVQNLWNKPRKLKILVRWNDSVDRFGLLNLAGENFSIIRSFNLRNNS
jgi:hypothetical protein